MSTFSICVEFVNFLLKHCSNKRKKKAHKESFAKIPRPRLNVYLKAPWSKYLKVTLKNV